MKSFLQTISWLKFQESLGHKTWRFDGQALKANIIRHDMPLRKNYLYVPHGPVVDFENLKSGAHNELKNFTAQVKALARENKSVYVKIEPLSDVVIELLFDKGFRHSQKTIQPHKSVVMDLTALEDQLLSKMHPKTRYNIGLASRKGLILAESEDVEVFWKLLKQTAEKDNFHTHKKDYYSKLLGFFSGKGEIETKLFLIKTKEDKPIGGAILLFFGDTVYYLHGAMDREYKSFMAPYFMHWELMKRAQQVGFKKYDFWGIDAQAYPGVTRFKLNWGGQVLEYPGSFDLPISKFWYALYKLRQKIK